MSRSSMLAPLAVLVGFLASCIAQEERQALQSSVARLEQRLQRMDDYLRSLQQAQSRAAADPRTVEQQAEIARLHALLAQRDTELEQLRAAIDVELRAANQHVRNLSEQFERELQAEREDIRRKVASDRVALEQRIEAALEEARLAREAARVAEERLRTQHEATAGMQRLERIQMELERRLEAMMADRAAARGQSGDPDRRQQGGAALRIEREAIDELRRSARLERGRGQARKPARVPAEEEEEDDDDDHHDAARHGASLRNLLLRRLRAEDGELGRLLAAMLAARGGDEAAPGSGVVIHNEEGEVHLHFHGLPAPALRGIQGGQELPRTRATPAAPAPAEPGARRAGTAPAPRGGALLLPGPRPGAAAPAATILDSELPFPTRSTQSVVR